MAKNSPPTSKMRATFLATQCGRIRFGVILLVMVVVVGALGYMAIHRLLQPRDERPAASAPPRGEIPSDIPHSPNKTAKIFFTTNGDSLREILISVRADRDTATQASILVETLLRGPPFDDFKPLLPVGTKLRGLFVDNNIAVVDLSSEALKPAPEQDCLSGELLAAYSLVNTILLNCEELRGVLILIQGKPVETLWGRVDLSEPLGANVRDAAQ